MTGLVLRLRLVIFGFVAFMYRNLLFALSLFFFSTTIIPQLKSA